MKASSTKPKITVCCSCHFYRQATDIEEQIAPKGFEIILPETAHVMKRNGDFNVSHYKTWFADPDDYPEKGRLMRAHFDEVARADAILVLNYEKNGRKNYIGPNVLMEMALAFYQQKPIFILNEIADDTPFEEELYGMMPVILHGRIEDFAAKYADTAKNAA